MLPPVGDGESESCFMLSGESSEGEVYSLLMLPGEYSGAAEQASGEDLLRSDASSLVLLLITWQQEN